MDETGMPTDYRAGLGGLFSDAQISLNELNAGVVKVASESAVEKMKPDRKHRLPLTQKVGSCSLNRYGCNNANNADTDTSKR